MSSSQSIRHGRGRWTLGLAFTLVFGLVLLFHDEVPTSRILPLQDVVFKTTGSRSSDKSDYKNQVSVPSDKNAKAVIGTEEEYLKVQQHMERWGGDLLNITHVQQLVNRAHDKLVARLKADYGQENFKKMFLVEGKSRGRRAFLSADDEKGISTKRFQRKLKMKILEMQAAVQSEREAFMDSSSRKLAEETARPPNHYKRFVWSTGGHSAAAGHGNLFNESYTAVMENAVVDIFGSIGIDFEARNHAMGGTASGPEIALCEEAVFGTDADVISWDYGMCDGSWYFRKAMYIQRAGLNPNRPAIIDLNIGGSEFATRLRSNKAVEERGLTTLYLNPDEFDAMEAAIPDTFGLSEEQAQAMPVMVRHYKCNDAIEKGEPTCDLQKYTNNDICPNRKGRASWHPGWKRSALWGNIMALFLSDMLLDSISDLASSSFNRTQLLSALQKQEDADYAMFQSNWESDIIEYRMVPLDSDLVDARNISVFFRNPSICHTARLPADIRHLGILTESEQVGVHDYEYFKGMPASEAKALKAEGTTDMPLVYDEGDREICNEAEIKRDYKDYFMVSNKMGSATLTVPNDAERRAYSRESEKLLGIIVVCPVPCDWGRCPEGVFELDAIHNGTLLMEVNDQSVTNITDFRGCSVLRGKAGHRWEPNGADQYVLKARIPDAVNATFSFFRINSIIVL